MSADAKNVGDLWKGVVTLMFQPFEILTVIGLLYLVVGWASAGAFTLAIISYCISQVGGKYVARSQQDRSSFADLRIKNLGEVLCGVKVVKTNGWMPKFHRRIEKVARLESRKSLLRKQWLSVITFHTKEFIDVMAFTMSALSILVFEQVPSAANLFTMWVFIAVLHGRIFAFPEALRKVAVARTSLQRCTTFLNLVPDTNFPALHLGHPVEENQVIPMGTPLALCDGNFAYIECDKGAFKESNGTISEEQIMVLRNINLELQNKLFYTVVGPVGSGKTSLLLSMMGELVSSSRGNVCCPNGSLAYAYVPQDPIVFQCSLRDNVCMGRPFEPEWFREVCEACALDRDIALFPHGDATILGSRGINISGGQQSRICLARAVYSRAEVFFLDDPLAKLDIRVSNDVFQRVIMGLLGQRLRIMVTTNPVIVKCSDAIITVREGTAHCSHDAGTDADFLSPGADSNKAKALVAGGPQPGPLEEDKDELPLLQKTTVECEETAFGCTYFASHIASNMGSSTNCVVYALALLMMVTASQGGVYMLSLVSDDPEGKTYPLSWYVSVYGFFMGCLYVIASIRYSLLCSGTQRSWDKLHTSLLSCVLNSSLSWLQGIPVGQLLQLFSSTLGDIDETMFLAMEQFLVSGSFLPPMVIIPCVGNPYLSIFFGGLLLYFLGCKKSSRNGNNIPALRQRHGALERECVQSYTDMLGGLSVVRTAQSSKDWFTGQFHGILSESAFTCLHCLNADESSLFRTNLIGTLTYGAICVGVVWGKDGGNLTVGYSGLMITNGCFMCFVMNILSTQFLVLRDVARKRDQLMHLIQSVPQEGHRSHGTKALTKTPHVWPSQGHLIFEHVELRYQPNLPPALRDLSFEVSGGEHFGIVGRTGSGKSTVLLAISRLLEIGKGRMLLDNVNIGQISLQDLRQHLCVLSQDPLFFSGSLRENLDPFTEHSDEDLWASLKGMSLDMFLKGQGLETQVAELGGNISTGQRQLLCLARAGLKASRLLLVDEATAALDDDAEKQFRQALKERFFNRDVTVLEVAHRLWSICWCDQIAVLDKGSLAEIGSPMDLLQPLPLGGEIFQSMVAALGEAESKEFYNTVRSHPYRDAVQKRKTAREDAMQKVAVAKKQDILLDIMDYTVNQSIHAPITLSSRLSTLLLDCGIAAQSTDMNIVSQARLLASDLGFPFASVLEVVKQAELLVYGSLQC
eukprot:gnl/MRDRNA2_/MRDRNA2_85876_c0_seq2.p1 gnl/MRDRNA2_/MRDRNA2_85876_c0~~gnl/MRDRNA2_/MRDRNA2_85876_c0_seq2.p1  ORF type:complete len:1354 (+),score=204.16 gnl/MRDRNA2_/MRDRNA2_85876_c0_seq2:461-4063(+)